MSDRRNSSVTYSLINRFNEDIGEVLDEHGEIPPEHVEAGLQYGVLLAQETPRVDIEIRPVPRGCVTA